MKIVANIGWVTGHILRILAIPLAVLVSILIYGAVTGPEGSFDWFVPLLYLMVLGPFVSTPVFNKARVALAGGRREVLNWGLALVAAGLLVPPCVVFIGALSQPGSMLADPTASLARMGLLAATAVALVHTACLLVLMLFAALRR